MKGKKLVVSMEKKVLILDYSDYEREKVKISLQNIASFHWVEAANLAQLNSIMGGLDEFALIIMDINFPVEKEGFNVLSSFRKNPRTAKTPVIITSRSDSEEYRSRVLQFSVNDYIVKPYQPKRLESSVRSIVKLEKRFSYSFNTANVITLSIQDYIAKELNISARAKKNLSVILITPVSSKEEGQNQTPVSFDLKKQIYEITTQRVKDSSRTTDTVILNDYKDILIILPFTNASGAKMVSEKILTNINDGLQTLNMTFHDYFYSVWVTYPEEGKNFLTLMENAFKKIEAKIMLEKLTSIGQNVLDNATRGYKRFKKS